MPSTTAGGLPYPLGTEPVRDGDNAIKNLADALQARGHGNLIQAGSAVVTLNAAGDGQFSYGAPFKTGTKPAVLLQVTDPLGSFWVAPNYASSNNTACPFRVTIQSGAGNPIPAAPGPWRVSWIAVGTAP